jgi:hypothetical protein
MPKKPTAPQGNSPLEIWLRTLLLPYLYSLELTSVVGFKKKANPHGGFALVKDTEPAAGGAEFPFQVYRSDPDYLHIMLTEGWIVTTGVPFQPTNMETYVGLTENATNWVYMEIETDSATIAASTTLPTWSTSKIMVAKVVTTTAAASLTITQILRENPQIPCV